MENRRLVVACCLIASVAVVAAACAGTSVTEDDLPSSTASQGGGTTTGVGGAGGAVVGTGGNTGACGTDCTLINTPQCQVAQCNVQTGQCEVVNDEDGVACDDGLFCTISDSCSAGTCAGGPQNDCGMSPPACTEVTCDETSQTCSTAPSMNGAPCQDPNDLCVKGAMCSNGLCLGGTLDDCFFFPVQSDCHVATCDPVDGMCKGQIGNEGQNCNDPMDLCTVDKTCATGVCQGGTPKDCSQLTMGCFDGVCDTMTGQCMQVAIMPGGMCSEATDQCNQGICDTMGMCNPQPANEGQTCDDGNACTATDTCQSGTCIGVATITQCINGDMCCPNNCTINNDNDCNLCGNSMLEVGEESDPPPGPSTAVPLDTMSCRFDFSTINQWYCNGTCGTWGGPSGCDQGDADAFCRLKMDNPNSTATSFGTGTATAAPGVCCPNNQPGSLGCQPIGVLTSRNVTTYVAVHDTSVLSTHGAGTVIINLVCTNP